MYKALNYWVFGGFTAERTCEEFIDWAQEQGLDGVELTIGDLLPLDTTDERAAEIKAYAASKNIKLRSCAFSGGWTCSIASPDKEERELALSRAEQALRIASGLGAESLLVLAGATRVAWDPSRPVVSYKTTWEISTESVKKLLPIAEKYDVNLALENVWNRFLISPMEWLFFLKQFDSPKIGMYFDVGNVCLYGRPQDYPEILGSYIKAVHIKNFEETDCGGGLHGFGDDLMKGEVDFKATFDALKAANYNGPFTAEMIPFSRLPDMVLPDLPLAEKVAAQMKELEQKFY